MKELADNLKRIQREKGYTQVELAEQLGIAQSTLSGYISNHKEPTISTVAQFAQRLNMTIGELCGEGKCEYHLPQILTYGDAANLIEQLLSIRRIDRGNLFDISIDVPTEPDPETGEIYETIKLTCHDNTLCEYINAAMRIKSLVQDSLIDEQTYGQIMSGLREKLYALRVLTH